MIPENFFAWTITANVFGSIAILVVLAGIPVVRRFFGARLAFLLWLVVLARLLVPVFPTAPFGPLSRESSPVVVSVQWLEGSVARPAVAEEPPLSLRTKQETTLAIAQKPPKSPAWHLPAIGWMGVWLAGVLGFGGLAACGVVRGWRIRRRATDVTSATRRQVPELPGRLRVLTSEEVRGPALHGLWSPVILLPAGWEPSEEEFRCVLLHEIGHFRRGDLWWRWAFVVARTIHWFNPLVWWADRVSRHDQELACDEWVLAMTSAEARNYGESILSVTRMLGRRRGSLAVQAPMAESARGIERRLRNLCAGRGMGRWGIAVTGLTVVGLVFGLGPLRVEAGPPASEVVAQPTQIAESEQKSANTGVALIEIESKYVEVPPELADEWFAKVTSGKREFPGAPGVLSKQEFQELIRWIDGREGVSAVSSPTVTFRSGARAVVNIIREFRYPTKFHSPDAVTPISTPAKFETRNLGMTIELEATLGPDDEIGLNVVPEMVTFLGFVNYGEDLPKPREGEEPLEAFLRETPKAENTINQPIFDVRKTGTSLSVPSGQTVMLGGMIGRKAVMDFGTNLEAGGDQPSGLLYVFLTARRVTPEVQERRVREAGGWPLGTNAPLQPPVVSRESDGMPYGIPVPGKPGFVTSPHAPSEGYVDLRGYPSGTEVKCPYSQKMFLVP